MRGMSADEKEDARARQLWDSWGSPGEWNPGLRRRRWLGFLSFEYCAGAEDVYAAEVCALE